MSANTPTVLVVLIALVLTAGLVASAVAAPLLPGDATGDGRVDGADYTVWSDNYAPGVGGKTWQQGDFSGNGIVDGGDFTIWADNYGRFRCLATKDVWLSEVGSEREYNMRAAQTIKLTLTFPPWWARRSPARNCTSSRPVAADSTSTTAPICDG